MGCPVLREESSQAPDRVEMGWYLLRRGGVIEGRRCRAGSILECDDTSWSLHDGSGRVRLNLPIPEAMLYRGAFEGLSLYVVERADRGKLLAHRLFQPQEVMDSEIHLIGGSLEPQETLLCVRFGCCFFPLDFFGW